MEAERRPETQWEARVAAFQRKARAAQALAEAAEREIDEALVENQINFIGMEAAEALQAQDVKP